MRTNDGIELRGQTPEELLRELHKTSRAPCATDAEFMHQMAGRAALQTGKRISARSVDEFIRSLVAAGILIDE